jgi:hypothetical protein
LADWLYGRKDELTKQVNAPGPQRDTGEQERLD